MTAVGVEQVVDVVSRPVWPLWEPPARAWVEWVALQVALVELGRRTPCVREPEVWFSGGQSARLVEAVEGCGWCPVRVVCAAYGVAADERDGVWGGLTPADRRALAGRRR